MNSRASINSALMAAGAALGVFGCGDPAAPTSGSLAITTSTSGPEPDTDGYAVTIDGGTETPIAVSGTVQHDGLEPGTHNIQLTGFALNCSVEGENPRPVTVTAGQQASTTFSVLCPTHPPYRVTDLGTLPGGQYSTASDINSAGQVVGTSNVPVGWPGVSHPFLWEGGVMTDITRPPQNPNDPETGEAAAISPDGKAVGWIKRLNGRPQFPWLWEQGVMNTFANGEGYATDINAAGQVVGCRRGLALGSFDCHAVIWENGTLTDLGTLSGGFSVAYGIDPTGRVVGQSDGHAFLWENGVMSDLNILGGESLARRINAAGQVAGQVVVDGVTHGFMWENGVTSDLGEVIEVNDINAGGQVVGWRDVDGMARAFVWQNGIMTDLPGPSRAFGINDEGGIVGSTGEPYLGASRATLWTPWEQ